MRIANWNRPPTPKTKKVEDKPEQGKIYSLFGGTGEPCIAAGNTWAESEVKEDDDDERLFGSVEM
jgi:hypothetical protein